MKTFTLKQIPGAVMEKKHIHESSAVYMPFEDIGYNQAIDEVAAVTYVHDVKKIESLIIENIPVITYMSNSPYVFSIAAQAIASAGPEILRVVRS